MSPIVTWKIDNVTNDLGDPVRRFQGKMTLGFFTAYDKTIKEKDELKITFQRYSQFSSYICRKWKPVLTVFKNKVIFHIPRPSHVFKLRKDFGAKVKCRMGLYKISERH